MSQVVQLTTPQAAVYYGVPVRTLQAAIKRGDLKATMHGPMYALAPEDVEAFAEQWKQRQVKRSRL